MRYPRPSRATASRASASELEWIQWQGAKPMPTERKAGVQRLTSLGNGSNDMKPQLGQRVPGEPNTEFSDTVQRFPAVGLNAVPSGRGQRQTKRSLSPQNPYTEPAHLPSLVLNNLMVLASPDSMAKSHAVLPSQLFALRSALLANSSSTT